MPEANRTAQFKDFGLLNPAVPIAVYTRDSWDDEWELQPYLYCNSAVWTLAPGTGTAELTWKYGLIKQSSSDIFQTWEPDDGHRRYVKIEFQNEIHLLDALVDPEPIVWYGMVLGVGDRAGGIRRRFGEDDEPYATGEQAIHCVGLERILDDTLIKTSAWSDDGELKRIDRGLTFNANKADGNMGGNMATAGTWPDGVPLFSGVVRIDDEFWTTPSALRYLNFYHRPMDKTGVALPFAIDPDGLALLLLTHDRPQIKLHGRSLREVLNQLLPHQRFVSWYLDVDEDFNAIFLHIVPLTGDNLILPSADLILANPTRWVFNIDESHGDGVIALSHAESVDRVRVQGARATSTFTISYADGTLEAAYTAAQKTLYDTGATGSAPYTATTNKAVQLRLHAERRAHEDCRMVYALFGIPSDWDGVAGNGVGDPGVDFCPIETETPLFKFYQRELYIEPFTALKDGYVYTALGGTAEPVPPVKSDTGGPHNHLPIQVFIQIPETGTDADLDMRWTNIEQVGLASHPETVPGDASRKWSANVTVPRMDRTFLVKVSGEPQYVLAGADYTKKSEEDTYGAWDWKTIIATVTCKWDAFCEGVYPPLADVPDNDYVREALFDAGDEYKLDWLVPGTVVALDTDGQLVRSAAGGWIQDDREKLEDRARLAFAWYGVERRAIQLPTSKINGTIKLGDFVVEAGVEIPRTINTVVSSIRIDCPPGANGSDPPVPIQVFTTDYIPDLDLFLSPNLEKTVPKAPAAAAGHPADVPMLRTWETDVPRTPDAGPQPGQFPKITNWDGRVF